MKPWRERTREEAHLLNPAFCCQTIASACAGYSESNDLPFPFALVFMVLPIVLHKDTRQSLPPNTRTSLPAWLQEHAEAKIGFHERTIALKPHTREALQYGIVFGWIAIGNSGGIQLVATGALIDRSIRTLTGDAGDCVARARFLGRWFRKMDSTETTMALWGIRP